MLRPITCKCGESLGWYDAISGLIRQIKDLALPPNLKMFGAYILCQKCERVMGFNGQEIRRKQAKKNPPAIPAKTPIAAAISGALVFCLALVQIFV